MSEIQNTPCGCRGNSGTQHEPGSNQFVTRDELDRILAPISRASFRRALSEPVEAGVNLPDSGDDSAERGADVVDAIVGPFERRVKGGVEFVGDLTHEVSPVCSEPSARNTCDSALTVSENPGAGAVSPAVPASPRYVQAFDRVFDREVERVAIFPSGFNAAKAAELLNAYEADAKSFEWSEVR